MAALVDSLYNVLYFSDQYEKSKLTGKEDTVALAFIIAYSAKGLIVVSDIQCMAIG